MRTALLNRMSSFFAGRDPKTIFEIRDKDEVGMVTSKDDISVKRAACDRISSDKIKKHHIDWHKKVLVSVFCI